MNIHYRLTIKYLTGDNYQFTDRQSFNYNKYSEAYDSFLRFKDKSINFDKSYGGIHIIDISIEMISTVVANYWNTEDKNE